MSNDKAKMPNQIQMTRLKCQNQKPFEIGFLALIWHLDFEI